MTIHILYDPSGQPQQVFDVAINGFLKKGYSIDPPYQEPTPISTSNVVDLRSRVELSGELDINTASLKELQALPHVGVAIARKIGSLRPYTDLSDLIQKVSDVPWLDLRDRITLSDPNLPTPTESDEKEEENTQ
jgi:hypothetical protein